MTNEEWAYLAGIIDGEGHITIIENGSGGNSIHLYIANKDEGLMEWLYNSFEHSGVVVNGDCLRFQLHGRHTLVALKGALPYLKVKRRQAELVIEYVEKCLPQSGHHVSDIARTRRNEIVGIFRTINKRGVQYE